MGQVDRRSTGRPRRRITTAIAAVFALTAGVLSLADATPVAAGAATAKLVYVAGSNGPPNGDKPIVELAEDLGFDVIVLDDDTPNLAAIVESFTPAVIVVSSTVTPIKIDDMFTDSPRPVVTWEPYIFDDLGLTESGGGNRGEVSGLRGIRIVDPTHPVTAPLSGQVTVTSAQRPMSYGVPAGDVQALATIAGSSTRAGIMVAEAGDQLADGVAAGLRVALFMSWSSPPVLNDTGRAIVGKAISWAGNFTPPAPNLAPVVDAGDDVTIMLPNDTVSLDATVTDDSVQLPMPAIRWTGPAGAAFDDDTSVDTNVTFANAGSYVLRITADDGEFQTFDEVHVTVQDPEAPAGTEVIFVVGNAASPASNDQIIEAKLLAAGLSVTFVDDDALPGDLTGVDGVVISTSVKPTKVGTAFTDVDIPILTWEGYLLDDLGLSDGPNGETPNARKTINIVDPAHPLAAGFSGFTSVITSARRMAFGTPGAGAEVVAFDGSPNANRAVIFAYLTDAPLPGGGTAPARRVVVFPNYGGTGLLTLAGMDLIDASIAFFLVPDNQPPTVDDQGLDIDENSPNGTVVGTIAFDDPDLASGDVVTVSVTGGTGSTAFDVSAAGEITVADSAQLDHETTSSFTLDVTVTDTAGETDTAVVTIDVNDINDAPIALGDFVTTTENGGFTVDPLFNDSDPDGDAFFLNSVEGLPPGTPGTVTTAGGRTASFSSIAGVQGVSRIIWPPGQGVFNDLDVGETDQATIDYEISDGNGGFASSTLTVTINGAANPPAAANFGVTAIGNTQLRAGTGETGPVSPPAKIVTNNLVTASTNAVSATAATGQATTQGGFVDINTNGSFVYTPPTGFTGADTFTYEVVGADAQTATGTVTVTVADMVWYVSTTGTFSSTGGRSHDPIHPNRVDVAGTGDTVYFFPSPTNNYDTDGNQPLTGQTWIGAGVPLVVDGVTLAAAGTAPTFDQLSAISSADVTMRGMTVAGLASFGGAHRLTIDDVAITRYFILVNSNDVSIDIDSFNDLGGGGVNITNVTGLTTFGSLSATTLGGGTLAYLNLDNAGTVTINGTTNTINKPNGPVVNIANTTIAGSGTNGAMAFQSLTGQSISLNAPTGGFEVTGTIADTTCGGATAGTCSGGTVGSVSLTNAADVSLNKLKVLDSGDDAVTVTGNSTVSIVSSEITGAGDAPDEDGIVLSQTGGSFTLMDSLVTGFHDTGIRGLNTTGTATVTIDGNHFSDNHEITNGGDGENAIDIRTQGDADLTVNVTDNDFDDIEGSAVKVVNESGGASIDANVVDNRIGGLGGSDDFPTFPAIELITDNLGALAFDVLSNEIINIPGIGIRIAGEGAISGRIGGTTAALGNTVNGTTLGDGIELDITGENGDNFLATILVQRNTLQNLGTAATSSVRGIQILHRDNLGTMNLTIDNNEISNVRDEGIRFFADHDGGVGQGNPVSNVRIANNAFAGIPVDEEVIRVSSADTAATCAHIANNSGFDAAPTDEINLPLAGTATLAITQASIAALITANPGAAVTAAPGITFNGGCTNPTLPTNP